MSINKFQLAAPSEFTRKMISDLAEFQNYGGSGRFKKLGTRLLSHPWPTRFTKAPAKPVWRIMTLPEKTFNEVTVGKKYIVDHVSSWTAAESVAREFVRSHWFQDYASDLHQKGKNPVAVLLKLTPKGKVLDIGAIHKDKAFQATRQAYEDQGVFFNEGLDFGDSQQEVALPKYVISKDTVADYATLDMRAWNSGKQF